MELAMISVVADTAAAFGVIGSLIFVGFQMRQNSKGLRYAAVQSLTSANLELFSNVTDSQEMAEIALLNMQSPEKIKGASRIRLYAYGTKIFRTFQGIHWQWQQGVLDDELFHSLATFFVDLGNSPGWRQIWNDRRHQYDPAFQSFMDNTMGGDTGKPLFPEVSAGVD